MSILESAYKAAEEEKKNKGTKKETKEKETTSSILDSAYRAVGEENKGKQSNSASQKAKAEDKITLPKPLNPTLPQRVNSVSDIAGVQSNEKVTSPYNRANGKSPSDHAWETFNNPLKNIDFTPVVDSAGYVGEKLGRGAIDGVENLTDFAWSLVGAAGWGVTSGFGLFENDVSRGIANWYNDINNNDLTDTFGSAEERYESAPKWLKEWGWLPETVGNIVPFTAELMYTGGASSADDIVLAGKSLWEKAVAFFANPQTHYGMSAAGGATEEAVKKGANPGTATLYGGLSGAGEVLTENMFGGLAGTGVGKSFVKFTSKYPAVNKALDILGEGAEEMIMTGVDPALQRATGVDANAEWASWHDYIESGAHGMILSVVMNAATMPIQSHNKKVVITEINKSSEAINAMTAEDAPKMQPLAMNATEEDIKNRQTEINEFARAYNFFVAMNVGNEQREAASEADTLEKAAMDVVAKRNATQTDESAPVSNVSTVGDSLPTQEENKLKTENKPLNDDVAFGVIDSKVLEDADPFDREVLLHIAGVNTPPTDVIDFGFDEAEIEAAESKATAAAFEAGRQNVPREKVRLETPEQEEAYNNGRIEHIKNMPKEASDDSISNGTADVKDEALPEYVHTDDNGAIRFKQNDIDYSDNTMRESKFYTNNANETSGRKEVKGSVVGKYGVHQNEQGTFSVSHLQSGLRMATVETLKEAKQLAQYLNENVGFNDVSYRMIEGKGCVPNAAKDFASKVKRIIAEKPYLMGDKSNTTEKENLLTSVENEHTIIDEDMHEAYYSLESEDENGRSEIYDRDGRRNTSEFDGEGTRQLFEEQGQRNNGRGTEGIRRGIGSIHEEQKRSSETEVISNGIIAYTPISSKELTESAREDIKYAKKHGIRVHVAKGSIVHLKSGTKARGFNNNKTDIYYDGNKKTFGHELGHLIKKRNPKAYEKLVKAFEDNIPYEQLVEILYKYASRYTKAYGNKAWGKAEEEFICDQCGLFYEMGMKSDTVIGKALAEYFDLIDVIDDGHTDNVSYFSLDTDGIADLDDLIAEYGEIEPGEKPAREVHVPKKTAKDKKVSQTVRTILEAKATPDEAVPTIEKMVEDGVFSYDVYTDKQAIKDAEENLKTNGWVNSLNDWLKAVDKGEVSKELTTQGWALYNNAANTATTAETETERRDAVQASLTILDAMVRHQRSAAQALQATRILKTLSPETQLYGIQKSVEQFKKELTDKYGKKAPEIKINEELAKKFLTAETEEARAEAEIEIYKDIGRQMPSRFIDKWNAWRYLAMLGNPRTHIRNILGNAGFAPIVGMKNLTATVIEALVAPVVKLSGKKMLRGKALVWGSKADRALLKAAWGDYSNVADTVSNGGKYSDSAVANQHIEEGRRIFKTKPLEWARKGNSKLLEKEDVWFSKPHYAYALAQYCKANNITPEQIARGRAIDPAREYAIKEAQKATYKDTNAFSQFVSELGRSGNKKNPVTKGASMVLEGILPFRKTPANILVRGVEYSPLGLLKGLADIRKLGKGEMTATEFIDNISAGLTGTGLLGLGVYLAAQGFIRGHGEEDKDEKDFKELMGHQSYALELPNGQSITLDWLAPEALPFFVGVNIWEATRTNKEMNLSTILQAVSNISEPMLEMSCLQGLNGMVENMGYASSNDTSGLVAFLSSAVTSYLTQGIPTLFGQAERTSEEHRMTTYTEKNSFLTGDMQYTLGKVSAKIPFWDYNQIPYIDAWGRKEASGTALKRGLNNFLNPAYTSTVETSDMEKELLRLYEETGEGGVFPERADKYFTVDGVRKDLTAEEYVRYATLKGEKSYEAITELVSSKAYKKLTDAEKVKAIEETYDYANQKAKQAISNYKPDTWVNKADDFSTNSGNYISFRAEVSNTKKENGGNISKQEVTEIILDMAENDSEMWDMYLSMYDSEKDKYAYDNGIKGEDYMDFLAALDEVDEPTESGKYGTYTQQEAYRAVNQIEGLSREEKAILWQSVNLKWKKNPFR